MKVRKSLRACLVVSLLALPFVAATLGSDWVEAWGWPARLAVGLGLICSVVGAEFLIWSDDPWGLCEDDTADVGGHVQLGTDLPAQAAARAVRKRQWRRAAFRRPTCSEPEPKGPTESA